MLTLLTYVCSTLLLVKIVVFSQRCSLECYGQVGRLNKTLFYSVLLDNSSPWESPSINKGPRFRHILRILHLAHFVIRTLSSHQRGAKSHHNWMSSSRFTLEFLEISASTPLQVHLVRIPPRTQYRVPIAI
jgi:hypothetical protein